MSKVRCPNMGKERMVELGMLIDQLSDYDIQFIAMACAREVMNRQGLGDNASILLSSKKHSLCAAFGRGTQAAALHTIVEKAIQARINGP